MERGPKLEGLQGQRGCRAGESRWLESEGGEDAGPARQHFTTSGRTGKPESRLRLVRRTDETLRNGRRREGAARVAARRGSSGYAQTDIVAAQLNTAGPTDGRLNSEEKKSGGLDECYATPALKVRHHFEMETKICI